MYDRTRRPGAAEDDVGPAHRLLEVRRHPRPGVACRGLAGAPGIDENRNRGLSSLDRPHVFALSAQYETGGPAWLKGFQANVIVIAPRA